MKSDEQMEILEQRAFTHEQLLFLYYNNASFNHFVQYMCTEALRRNGETTRARYCAWIKGNSFAGCKAETESTETSKTIAVCFEVNDSERLRFILSQNGYRISEASECLWSAVRKPKR